MRLCTEKGPLYNYALSKLSIQPERSPRSAKKMLLMPYTSGEKLNPRLQVKTAISRSDPLFPLPIHRKTE